MGRSFLPSGALSEVTPRLFPQKLAGPLWSRTPGNKRYETKRLRLHPDESDLPLLPLETPHPARAHPRAHPQLSRDLGSQTALPNGRRVGAADWAFVSPGSGWGQSLVCPAPALLHPCILPDLPPSPATSGPRPALCPELGNQTSGSPQTQSSPRGPEALALL